MAEETWSTRMRRFGNRLRYGRLDPTSPQYKAKLDAEAKLKAVREQNQGRMNFGPDISGMDGGGL